MGNSHESADEVDSYVHPRLGTIKRIQEPNKNQLLGYELVLENQKVYEDWVKELRYIKKEEAVDEILFLPIDHAFRQTTYCGTGGLAVVRSPPRSCATRTTSTPSPPKSKTDAKSNAPSTNRNSSTSFTTSSRQKRSWRDSTAPSATSSPKTSWSMRTAT
jgi:hypothetical protein